MTSDLAHDTMRVERHFDCPAGAVFDAYADIDQRIIWCARSDDDIVIFEAHDFTVRGIDRFLCGLKAVQLLGFAATITAISYGATVVLVALGSAIASVIAQSHSTPSRGPAARREPGHRPLDRATRTRRPSSTGVTRRRRVRRQRSRRRADPLEHVSRI